VYKIAIFALKN